MRTYLETTSGEALSRENPLVRKLATKSGLSAETIYRSALGDRVMSRHSAELLSKATKGALTVTKILGLDKPVRRK